MAESIHIQAPGITLTSSTTSTSGAIPNTGSGIRPNHVRIQVTNYAYVKFGASTVTATNSDILLSPNNAEHFRVSGNTHIAVIQHNNSASVNITPLEDI